MKIAKKYDEHTFSEKRQVFNGTAYTIQKCYNIKEFDIHCIGTVNKPNICFSMVVSVLSVTNLVVLTVAECSIIALSNSINIKMLFI